MLIPPYLLYLHVCQCQFVRFEKVKFVRTRQQLNSSEARTRGITRGGRYNPRVSARVFPLSEIIESDWKHEEV